MQKEMTKEEALAVLDQYQMWRLGLVNDFPSTVSQISEALVISISVLRQAITDEKANANGEE